ncbi:hypothetical protein BDN71DRAFT_1513454 [Pleurotus eryngii]|uniref:Uncharacterized protein n=1 Tax=Pleurotus eryngii TaxID=5323 RepID=A0A9P5ZLG7_PLEER|nr:hypothetical protein BDN71DRAFT_1513454 [Pleurotus eryngii]
MQPLGGVGSSPPSLRTYREHNHLWRFPDSRPELETFLKQTVNLKAPTLEEPHGTITLPDVLCDGTSAFSLERFTGEPPADDNLAISRFITEFLPAQRKMRHLSLTWAGDAPSLPPASFPGLYS